MMDSHDGLLSKDERDVLYACSKENVQCYGRKRFTRKASTESSKYGSSSRTIKYPLLKNGEYKYEVQK
jgi:hypothetical protein